MNKKIIIPLAVTLMMLFSMTAYADTKITSVSVSVNETREEPGTVWTADVTVNSNEYTIEDYKWSSDYEFWEPGKKVTLNVTLVSDEYSFDRNPYVYGYNCEKVSMSRDGSKRLKLKFNYIPRVTLNTPSGIHYEEEYLLSWDKVEYAGGYEVQLYKDGNYYNSIRLEGRGTTEVDLAEYATDDYLVTSKIKAVAPSGKSGYISDSEWAEFDDEGVSLDGNSTAAGKFSGSGTSKRFYDDAEDGQYKTGWQYINGFWYYFNMETGYAVTDAWLADGGLWYLFDTEGRLLTGWRNVGGHWYFLNNSPSDTCPYGAMKTGWIQTGPNSPYYYLNAGSENDIPYGAMLTDRNTPDGYFVNQNGEWIP